jgi:hypothetical protein
VRHSIWLALLLAACAPKKAGSMAEDGKDQEVATQIMLLETPFGDPQHLRERDLAAAWLVANSQRSYPRLLAGLEDASAGPAILELIPRFQRAESIPLLKRLMAGPEPPAWAAGQALALHPQPEAGVALRQALESPNPGVVVIAADALGTRGDLNDCAALAKILNAANPRVRYHAVQASAKLACLKRDVLEGMARSDVDADVRSLAAQLLSRTPL